MDFALFVAFTFPVFFFAVLRLAVLAALDLGLVVLGLRLDVFRLSVDFSVAPLSTFRFADPRPLVDSERRFDCRSGD